MPDNRRDTNSVRMDDGKVAKPAGCRKRVGCRYDSTKLKRTPAIAPH